MVGDKLKSSSDMRSLSILEKVLDPPKKMFSSSNDRDIALSHVERDKTVSLIKAWEINEKTKADNKAIKKLSDIASWENSKKGMVEGKLRNVEVVTQKRNAEYAEKKRNAISAIQKIADEKRAHVEAQRKKELLHVEETAAKHRATGTVPKKSTCGCLG
ncbi:Uncharacterized protein ZOSMA_25G00240 [Zostera marina]|uniref:Remorin C-terminal domain-containing protein n=1 Tax=Zostera marina TaxID=29655 RepID=A0A0K9PF12_ZOSMR|nr:Uncharacterized protein ZOSMA_25G00240 [Zostera marina]